MAHEGEHDAFVHFAGSYQGILVDSPAGDPVGKVDFTVTSTGALSGALLLKGQKSFKFKSSLIKNDGDTISELDDTANLTNFDVVKPKEGYDVKLSLSIAFDGSFTVDGDALLPTLTTEFVEAQDSTARLSIFEDCPWAGTYTMAFPFASNNDGRTPPGGASIGTATVKADGVMTATGNLADGTKFSFSARPSEDGTYRVFISPYKTVGCFYTMFQLTQREDDSYEVDGGDGMAGWSKSANAKDKTYPLGFDVDLGVAVVEWTAPSGDQTLGDLLGLEPDKILDIDFFSGLSTSTYEDFLPTSLGLNLNNTFRIASANGGPSVTDQKSWAKIFTSKVDPKTGRITVTINITDLVEGKTIKRKVTVNGVLMQLESDLLDQPYAFGHLLIPPLDKTTGTTTSGGFDLPGPIYVDEIFAATANTVGTYSALLDLITPGTPPSGVPADGSTINFTVSSDLSELTFNGRKVPFLADSRPVAIVFSDASDNPTNSLTVTLYLNGSGIVTSLATQYVKVAFPSVDVRNHTSDSVIKIE